MDPFAIEWSRVGSHSLYLLAAYILSLPIAWNREKESRSAGLRTFPLVAVASCALVLIGKIVMSDSADAQARILQGLMTGVGFIGGGAILKHGASVEGTAKAASLWATGVAGIAVAYQRVEIAVALSLITFFTLRVLTPLKTDASRESGQ